MFKKLLTTLLFLIVSLVLSKPAFAQVTPAQVIDQYPDVPTVSNSSDIVDRIRTNISRLLQNNTHRNYPGMMLTEDLNKLMWFKGMEVATLSQTLPFLDTNTRNSLKTFLQFEVTNYLLNSSYTDFEVFGNMSTRIPGATADWDSRNGGSAIYPETLYGLWAYAEYSGDWTTIQNNWSRISTLYSSITSTPPKKYIAGSGLSVSALAPNSELAGRIAYARMAKKMFNLTGTSSYQTAYNNAVSSVNNRISIVGSNISNTITQNQGCGWAITDPCGRDYQNSFAQGSCFRKVATGVPKICDLA